MRWTVWFTGAALLSAITVMTGACARQTPAAFCQKWAEDACQTATHCCQVAFDEATCLETLSASCLAVTHADVVAAGDADFDSGAARACLGTITGCAELVPPEVQPLAQRQACAGVVNGPLPPGSACSSSADCQQAGAFSVCYGGAPGGQVKERVCAQVVIDDQACAFSRDDNTLHVCPDGKYCTFPATDPNLPAVLEFSAPCADRVPLGGSCVNPADAFHLLPCQPGLACHVYTGSSAQCLSRRGRGEPCDPYPEPDACAAGLFCGGGVCRDATVTPDETCAAPPVCGDGACGPAETPDGCPDDCSGSARCGDSTCDATESAATCPEDCGGDSDPTCHDCACTFLMVEGGCQDACDMNQAGTMVPDFCNGASASSSCAMCIAALCGFPANACF